MDLDARHDGVERGGAHVGDGARGDADEDELLAQARDVEGSVEHVRRVDVRKSPARTAIVQQQLAVFGDRHVTIADAHRRDAERGEA
jgi:hypothetical protein